MAFSEAAPCGSVVHGVTLSPLRPLGTRPERHSLAIVRPSCQQMFQPMSSRFQQVLGPTQASGRTALPSSPPAAACDSQVEVASTGLHRAKAVSGPFPRRVFHGSTPGLSRLVHSNGRSQSPESLGIRTHDLLGCRQWPPCPWKCRGGAQARHAGRVSPSPLDHSLACYCPPIALMPRPAPADHRSPASGK